MKSLSPELTVELATYLFENCKKGVEVASLLYKKDFVMEIADGGGKAFAYIPSWYKVFAREDRDGKIKYGKRTYSVSKEPTNIVLVSFKLDGRDIRSREIGKIKIFSDVMVNHDFVNHFYLEPSNLSLTHCKNVLEDDVKKFVLHEGAKEERVYKFEFGV